MLSMFFVHDGGETQKWRLKGHAKADFWAWICSWAVMIRKPSDLGYEDERTFLMLGHCYRMTGQFKEALHYQQLAVDTYYPDSPGSRRVLEYLKGRVAGMGPDEE